MNSRSAAPVPQRSTWPASGNLGLVHLADQGSDDMRVVGAEVVAGPKGVGGDSRNEVSAKLRPVRAAQLQAGELGERVGLIGRLQRAGHQAFDPHRLGTSRG